MADDTGVRGPEPGPSHLSADERDRIRRIVTLAGDEPGEVLEVGARDGRVTHELLRAGSRVTALDICPRNLGLHDVSVVGGDVTALPFRDRTFDTVLCTEVLEHLPEDLLERARSELERVTRCRLLVTVPFEQDLAVGATRCGRCGTVNPPWGHLSRFTIESVENGFRGLEPLEVGTFGRHRNVQPRPARWLEARLGYPHGAWEQEEPCVGCGAPLERPHLSLPKRLLARIPAAMTRAARLVAKERPSWIYALFVRP